ncbi:hypothetical protein AB0F45_35090, partial [Streptomyces achromogenes]
MSEEALDAALRLVRAQTALVRRFDARLGGLHGVSLADFTLLLRLAQAPGARMPTSSRGSRRSWSGPP